MERANKFFFLSNVNAAKCDFRRLDDKVLLTFCHVDDKASADRLEVMIRTETAIDSDSLQTIKNHYVSYELLTASQTIKQADSLPIRDNLMVWEIVTEIANDVFK